MIYDFKMKKRNLSSHEKTAHQNLRKIWDDKKRTLGLTQEKAADVFGCSTANVGFYLTGTQPLNIKTTIAFANLLKVNPTDIDPRLSDLSIQLTDAELTLLRLFRRLDKVGQAQVVDSATRLMLDQVEVNNQTN